MNPEETHDQTLSRAFDGQAAKFENSPVQSNPLALARLVAFADFPADSQVLDVGCGPGLIAAELIRAGCRVTGVDLSPVMIERAERRCGLDRARFVLGSVFDETLAPVSSFDGVISRYVLHHVVDPRQFVARQVELLKPGGVLVLSDHTTDSDPALKAWHREIERDRDRSHSKNRTPSQIIKLFADAGLKEIRHVEETFVLDFDEWFDRGTPRESKAAVRAKLLSGPSARGWTALLWEDQTIVIQCKRSTVRGVKAV